MAYLGSKVLLAAAISAAIHSTSFAQTYYLDSSFIKEAVSLGNGITQLTGSSGYGVSLGGTSQLTVDATIGNLSQSNGLSVNFTGGDSDLTLNSLIAGQKAVTVSGSSGLITLNNGADIMGGQSSGLWAISANNFDVVMNGGRIVGNVVGVDQFEVRAKSGNNAVVTSANLGVNHLHVKSGVLEFQRQGTNISGNLTVDAGSAIGLQINENTDLGYALVYVDGEAVFEKDSIISLNTPSSQFLSKDTRYTLVAADKLIDNGVIIQSALSPFLELKDVEVFDNNSLLATIGLVGVEDTGPNDNDNDNDNDPDKDTGNPNNPSNPDNSGSLDTLAEKLQQQGASENAIRAAQNFVSVLASIGNDNALYQRFLDANGVELNALLDQLTPEASGSVVNAAIQASGLASSALGARATAVGANSGQMMQETGAWVQVLNGDATQARRNGVAGYDADSKGIIVGADGKLNDALTLGVALSLVNTDVSGAFGSETEVDTYLLSGYGRFESGAWGLTGSISYGQSSNDSKRQIANEFAKASYDSDLFSAELELGYGFDLGAYKLEPVTALRYSNVSVDGYREKGSSAALSNNSQRYEMLDLGVGVNVNASLGEFTPRARIMAYHDFAQDTIKSTSSFILGGNSFVTTGADATKWTYEAGVGLDWSRGQYTVGVGYDYIRKADFSSDTFSLKARYDF